MFVADARFELVVVEVIPLADSLLNWHGCMLLLVLGDRLNELVTILDTLYFQTRQRAGGALQIVVAHDLTDEDLCPGPWRTFSRHPFRDHPCDFFASARRRFDGVGVVRG